MSAISILLTLLFTQKPELRSSIAMDKVLHVALLGCGTVGGGVLTLLEREMDSIERRVGAKIRVSHVVVRDLTKPRVLPNRFADTKITTDADSVCTDRDVDILVEVMGGVELAGQCIEKAIQNGKSIVTANKALLAERGAELLDLAQKAHVDIAYEASVGGAIPIVRTLREHLVADRVRTLLGIVNGTCNYILTRMRDEGASFEEVLRAAQELGYAEAEPSLDVDGHDASHKLCVLASLAFGASLQARDVATEGIRAIEPLDIRFAARFGYAIKHLAVARLVGVPSALDLRVHPALVPARSPLASVDGVLNAIAFEADAAGSQVLVGRGAGALPTAVSVLADLVDVARRRVARVSGLLGAGKPLLRHPMVEAESQSSLWYLRLRVFDRPGVLARVAGALGNNEVSIEQLVQEGGAGRRAQDRLDDNTRVIVLLTHTARESSVRKALREIDSLGFTLTPSLALRVED